MFDKKPELQDMFRVDQGFILLRPVYQLYLLPHC